MKPHFLFPYWCRYLGYGLILVHIPITFFGKMHGMNNIMDNNSGSHGLFTSEHLFFIGTALMVVAGLFLVAFAKEKVEDKQIWQIRLDSLRWAIYLNYLILITSLVFVEDTGHILELNLWVPLVFFVIRFRWIIFRLNRSLSRES